MEIRLHGRGGQGGVTCAKILAAIYARMGEPVQTFGDYAGERSGAPVRAFTRVGAVALENRNKVYQPDHLLVLDPTLLGDGIVAGLAPGGVLLVNTRETPEALAVRFGRFRIATVDATSIARKHGIGTRSVVIVNTTIAGALARALNIDLRTLEETYAALGLSGNVDAAREAYQAVQIREAVAPTAGATAAPTATAAARFVLPLTDHTLGLAPGLKTGDWRTQTPKYTHHLAPCSAGCPAGNDVVGFVRTLATHGAAAAAQVLGRTTPFAAACGRVCPAPCMESCNRRSYDGTVNIRALERWIAEQTPVARREPAPQATVRRIAIVGGGPAGVSAAYRLAGDGHRVTLFEREAELGGVLRTGIPIYRLPRNVLDQEIAGVLRLGVEARCRESLTAERVAALAREYDGVLLATGLQRLQALDAPGNGLHGIEQGIRFLARQNAGDRTRCSGHVVVLGGGNTAMDCARSAIRAGAGRVSVVYRRTRTEMPAIAEEVEQAEQEGVVFHFQRQPIAFHGSGTVQAVECAEVEMGPPDASGRRRPVVSNRTERLTCDAVLLALGQSADTSLLPSGWELRDGRVWADGKPLRVFAAGDLATNDGTVTHAIGSGRRAAERLLQTLGDPVEPFVRPDPDAAVPITAIHLDHFPTAPTTHETWVPAAERARTYQEVSLGLPSAAEAQRCFSCGHCTQCDTCMVYCPEGVIRRREGGYDIDIDYCKGCGLCATECPRHAMEMIPR